MSDYREALKEGSPFSVILPAISRSVLASCSVLLCGCSCQGEPLKEH